MSTPLNPGHGAESDRWYATYRDERLVARRMSSHGRKLRQLGAFDLSHDSRILDVACGTGEALELLHDAGFTSLYGSDVMVDPELSAKPWVTVVQADAVTLPFENDSFDAVVCMHSLHHLGGLARICRTFEESLRILKPGGRLMLLDHYDSNQLRAVFWGLQKPWLTVTPGLKRFSEQHEEEWPYMYEYLDEWPAVRAAIDALPAERQVDRKGLFFFYWAGRKRVP